MTHPFPEDDFDELDEDNFHRTEEDDDDEYDIYPEEEGFFLL